MYSRLFNHEWRCPPGCLANPSSTSDLSVSLRKDSEEGKIKQDIEDLDYLDGRLKAWDTRAARRVPEGSRYGRVDAHRLHQPAKVEVEENAVCVGLGTDWRISNRLTVFSSGCCLYCRTGVVGVEVTMAEKD